MAKRESLFDKAQAFALTTTTGFEVGLAILAKMCRKAVCTVGIRSPRPDAILLPILLMLLTSFFSQVLQQSFTSPVLKLAYC
jgi:Na+-translocating ferredoxin:NAD+ oxidoreductase RnfE subunit